MFRYAILGFGRHAVKRLMPGFALAKQSRVTAICRRDLAAAQTSARENSIPLAFDSAEQMCASPEVDAVFVSSPDAHHLRDTLIALRHGKHVLCEKPMAMNASECQQMVDAAARANRLLGVAHVFRFEESTRLAREAVASGELGKILHARLEFHYRAAESPRKWITDGKLACGGPMADVGIHCIDGLRYILQDEIDSVSTVAVQDANSGPFECAAVMSLEFNSGTLGSVNVSSRAAYRTPLEIVGTKATLRAEDALTVDQPITMNIAHADGSSRIIAGISNHLAYTNQVDAFAEAVEGKTQFPAAGLEGLRNQLILDAAYRSWRTGKLEGGMT